MFDIYHVPISRSMRIIWLCEELELPYRVHPVDFSPRYRASPEWRRMNPVGKVPVMVDGDLKLFESGAMIDYILEQYGEGRLMPPPGTDAHALYRQWCWFAEATFARPVGEVVNHRRAFPDGADYEDVIDEMRGRVQLCCDALDAELNGKTWIMGAMFTAADILVGQTLLMATRFTRPSLGTALTGYFERISKRPAYIKAIADI